MLPFFTEKSQSLSGWDGVFHVVLARGGDGSGTTVAIPFRVGWGFSPTRGIPGRRGPGQSQSLSGWDGVFHSNICRYSRVFQMRSQSLSGWDGVFHWAEVVLTVPSDMVSQSLSGWDGVFHSCFPLTGSSFPRPRRNPFQGGMGFFTCLKPAREWAEPDKVAIPFRVGWGFSLTVNDVYVPCFNMESQSLSGWDGVFHLFAEKFGGSTVLLSQSLSGWDGVFHPYEIKGKKEPAAEVAIPFRVGWGFSLSLGPDPGRRLLFRRNPFQGGMGFFTSVKGERNPPLLRAPSQSLSGWDGVFHRPPRVPMWLKAQRGRNPFQGGMGFFTGWKCAGYCEYANLCVAIPFRVGWGFSHSRNSDLWIKAQVVAIPFRVGWGFSQR